MCMWGEFVGREAAFDICRPAWPLQLRLQSERGLSLSSSSVSQTCWGTAWSVCTTSSSTVLLHVAQTAWFDLQWTALRLFNSHFILGLCDTFFAFYWKWVKNFELVWMFKTFNETWCEILYFCMRAVSYNNNNYSSYFRRRRKVADC